MSNCEKRHRNYSMFDDLPNAQDNQNGGRHKCAACAYVEGLQDALKEQPKKNNLSHLPFSQAKNIRHKDAKMAYDKGYDYGIWINN